MKTSRWLRPPICHIAARVEGPYYARSSVATTLIRLGAVSDPTRCHVMRRGLPHNCHRHNEQRCEFKVSLAGWSRVGAEIEFRKDRLFNAKAPNVFRNKSGG